MIDFYNVAVSCAVLFTLLIVGLLYRIQGQVSVYLGQKGSSGPAEQQPLAGSPLGVRQMGVRIARPSLPLWLVCLLLLLAPLVTRMILQVQHPAYLPGIPLSDWTILSCLLITTVGIVVCFWIDHRSVLAQQKHMMHINAIESLKANDEGRERVLRAVALQTADVSPRKELVQ